MDERLICDAKKKQQLSDERHADSLMQPFITAEEAWFWFLGAYEARQEGARFTAGNSLIPRPCEPLDILKIVDRLHRTRRLLMDHLRIMKHYGERKLPPDPYRHNERRAKRLWDEAMERIEAVLISKGIVEKPYDPPGLDWAEKALVYENTMRSGRGGDHG